MPKIRKEQLSTLGGNDGDTVEVESNAFVFVSGFGAPTLAEVLIAGNTTGSKNIIIANSQFIQGTNATVLPNGDGSDLNLKSGAANGFGGNGIISLDASYTDFKLNGLEVAQINIAAYGDAGITGLILNQPSSGVYAKGDDGFGNGNKLILAAGNSSFGGELDIFSGTGAGGFGGLLNIAAGNGSTIGGGIQIKSGDGSSGVGGGVFIQSGSSLLNNAGNIQVLAGNATNNDTSGGAIEITSGNSSGFSAGGPIVVTCGNGGNNSNGGQLSLSAGIGGSASGDGGAVGILAGIPINGNGGSINIVASDAFGTNKNGGSILIQAGVSTGGISGTITLSSGNATGVNTNGGNISLFPGTGNGAGINGYVTTNNFKLTGLADAVSNTDALNLQSLFGTSGSVQHATTSTTNAIAQTIVTYSGLTSNNTSAQVYVRVTGVKDDGTDAASYILCATFKRISNTVSKIGSTTSIVSHESDATWDCTISASSPNVVIQVTGKNSTNISWQAVVHVVKNS